MKTFIVPIIRTDFIGRCLETMRKYNDDFRVILVDQTKAGVYNEIKEVDLYLRPRFNLGFSKSMNEGIHHALAWKSDYIICCNDDIEFLNEAWWEGILKTFEKFPRAMVVNPSSVADRNAEPRIPYKKEYTVAEYQKLIDDGKGYVIDGICMWMPVFPRETIEKIGLFEERFFPGGGEDYDYNARVYKAGGRCLGSNLSWMWHHWGKSKDEYETAKQEALPPHQDNWNDLGFLWPSGFDIYSPKGLRNPEVQIKHL